jgi:hypothetical protein
MHFTNQLTDFWAILYIFMKDSMRVCTRLYWLRIGFRSGYCAHDNLTIEIHFLTS